MSQAWPSGKAGRDSLGESRPCRPPTKIKGVTMIEDDCGGQCFNCRMTGLGFDDEQQQIVLSLMQQSQLAGVAWMLLRGGGQFDMLTSYALVMMGAAEQSPETINRCLMQAMRNRAQPMSDEVAAAVHRNHQ